ncbi:unnamed protein product [Owenia fusiformis]|uniref:Uncharacterized protein n=1 Tax=Owenia fusiformis TaxID=6347 RepID=A0A8J1TFA6_OWEFU|nr:unnamed protein product [Owenia fusiformis]
MGKPKPSRKTKQETAGQPPKISTRPTENVVKSNMASTCNIPAISNISNLNSNHNTTTCTTDDIKTVIVALQQKVEDLMDSTNRVLQQMDLQRQQLVDILDSQISKLKLKMDNEICTLRKNIEHIHSRLDILENRDEGNYKSKSVNSNVTETEDNYVVIKNLDQTSELAQTVNELFGELSIDDKIETTPEAVKRLPSQHDRPGIVFVALTSQRDKICILKLKHRLKYSAKFPNVYIDTRKSREQLQQEYLVRSLRKMTGPPK